MTFFNVLIIVLIGHCVLYFFDVLFKSCSHYPYIHFLQNSGLSVELFKIKWYTKSFNRYFRNWGLSHPKILRCWFTAGSWVSLGLVPLSTYMTIKACLDCWQTSSPERERKNGVTLEPLIPGINLPVSEVGYYGLTMIMCSIFHEFGHAVAAVREEVHVSGCGIILMTALPLSYVKLNLEQLENLSPKKQLRILCAGVWHNIVLAAWAALTLWILPLIFYPAFTTGNGVVIQDIKKDSPLLGPTGLNIGDQVVGINRCDVLDSETWYQCIVWTIKQPSPGYCVSEETIKDHDVSVPARQLPSGAFDCCGLRNPNHLCFEALELDGMAVISPQHLCLPGRKVVESSPLMCFKITDCVLNHHCLKPSLENSTRLVRIEKMDGNVVLFVGRPAEIYQTLTVSDYVPLYFIPSSWPEFMTQFSKYCIIFSSGLAFINAIPCIGLDGQYIIKALIDLLFRKTIPVKKVRQIMAQVITLIGTFFLIMNVLNIFTTKSYYL